MTGPEPSPDLPERRRTRRNIALAAAAVAILAVGGGILLSRFMPGPDPAPDPVGTPSVASASPSPAGTPSSGSVSPTPATRELTEANLLTADDIPAEGEETYTETPEGVGRGPQELTVCRPEGTGSEIGAEDVLGRNFRLRTLADGGPATPEPPVGSDPTIYTQALQFDSADAARAAYETYQGWLESCKKTITERGDTSAGAAPEWYPVRTKVSGAEARFTEVSWIPAGDESGSGYFESVGLALVGDRLAVTVSLVYGQDYNVAYDQDGDPDLGLRSHPQYGLLIAAADRLTR